MPVGNDYNDLDMLSWAGHAFVVENTPQAIKKQFTDRQRVIEVASNNNCAITDVVGYLHTTSFFD